MTNGFGTSAAVLIQSSGQTAGRPAESLGQADSASSGRRGEGGQATGRRTQAVELSSPDDYGKTVAFYKEALPKAGFQLGPEVKVPARKVYNLNFTRANVQDTLSIYPDKKRSVQDDDADRLYAGERMDP